MLSTATGIIREEGPTALWRGVAPALYRHVIYSGVRMVTYETLRDKVLKKNADGKTFPVWKSALGNRQLNGIL